MYSLTTGLDTRAVCEIMSESRQLIVGPACGDDCTPDSCDGIQCHPTFNTLCDLRMGPRLPGEKCRYYRCGLGYSECPGHPGRIKLASPCFAPHLVKAVEAILKKLCCRCRHRAAESTGRGTCNPCIKPFTKVEWVDGLMHLSGEFARTMNAGEVQEILRYVQLPGLHQDLSSLILTELEVIPTQYRPYVSSGPRCYPDPLTVLYANVLSANNEVRLGVNKLAYIDLQSAINCLFDEKFSAKTNAVSLAGNIGKKDGRIRQDLMGKRVDESARSVIVGDGDLGICEIGVPMELARVLSYPMAVLRGNLIEAKVMLGLGTGWSRCVLGGNEYIRATLPEKRLRFLSNQVQVGDTIYRDLRDGDLVIVNRQPTLHRNGFTAHIVHLVPDLAFHMPPNITEPFNADFDGDEVNLHAPQTVQALAELHVLLSVRENFIAPNELPSTGFIQNSLLAAFLITGQDVLFNREQAMQLLSAPNGKKREWRILEAAFRRWGRALPIPTVQYKRLVNGRWVHAEFWTGAQLLSCLMPPFDVGRVEDAFEMQHMVMRAGTILAGQLTKRDLGAAKNNLLHRVFLSWNAEEFMNTLNGLLGLYLMQRGFTVSLADCRIPIGDAPTFEDAKGPTMVDKLRYLRTMSQTHIEARIPSTNALRQMFVSGSKGKSLNATQIVHAVGPQDLGGHSPPLWLGQRSLPCFTNEDRDPEARGYVSSGYLKGLSPAQMFFHCAAARESMVISKLAPSKSGDLQRLTGECLKPLKIDYEGHVVGERDEIIQFRYADDGLDWTGQVVEPCTPVGIIAAQSLSEQITQKSLDSFHHVGESSAMPRLYELFYARDYGVVHAELERRSDALKFARDVSGRPLVASVKWAVRDDMQAGWARRWVRVYGKRLLLRNKSLVPFPSDRKALRLVLNKDAFFFESARVFTAWLGEPAMHSHEVHDATLEVIAFIQPETIWRLLKRLEPQTNGVKVRVNGCRVEADGLSLLAACQKLHEVPRRSLTTTNIRDIERFRGIEAARQSLFEQAMKLDAFQGVSKRHLSVLCDAMCSTGDICATKYTGMGTKTKSTLGRTVFQSPMPTFVGAAVMGVKEDFGNVSACLISGEKVPLGSGSGSFALIYDDALEKSDEFKPPFTPQPWYL